MQWKCCLALFLLAIADAIPAADSRAVVDMQLQADFVAAAISQPTADGYWAVGFADGLSVLLRYTAAGTVQFVRYLEPNLSNDVQLLAMPDGGATLTFAGSCSLYRFDADGRPVWTYTRPYLDYDCARPRPDGTGGMWLPAVQGAQGFYEPIEMFDADGYLHSPINIDNVGASDILPDPVRPQALAAGGVDDDAGIPKLAIWKLTANGSALLATAPDANTDGSLLVAGSDGFVSAFGTIGDYPNQKLYGMSIDPSTGNLRWGHSLAVGITSLPIEALPAPDGGSTVMVSDGNLTSIFRITAAGDVAWSAVSDPLTPSPDGSMTAHLAAAANGDVIVAQRYINESAPPPYDPRVRLTRYDSAGHVLFANKAQQPVGATLSWDLRTLPDGTSLVAALGFVHVGIDGGLLPTPATAGVVPQVSVDYDTVFGADGSSYYLATNNDALHYTVVALAPDGSTRWRKAFVANGTEGGISRNEVLVVRQNDVCLVAQVDAPLLLQCMSLVNGSTTVSETLATSVAPFPESSGVLADATSDGKLVVLYLDAANVMHHLLLDAQGTTLHDVTPLQSGEEMNLVRFDAAGNLGIVVAVDHVLKINVDGSRGWVVNTDFVPYRTWLTPDGGGLIVSEKFTGSAVRLTRVDANGNTPWKVDLPNDDAYRYVTSMLFTADSMFFAVGTAATPTFPRHGLIMRLSLADGSTTWSVPTQTVDSDYAPALLFDASGQRLLVVAEGPFNRLRFTQIDRTTGNIIADNVDGCGRDNCLFWRAAIGSDGVLRATQDASDGIGGSAYQLSLYRTPFDTTATRLDQSGIAGAWYAPYSSGRGFLLDYLADSRTIFMPWFTYGSSGTPDTADVAWYTLQGNVDLAATSAALTIFSTTPGTFATGTTSTVPVGKATLRFSDCTHGTLQYALTAGVDSGSAGTISLSRLSQPTAPCTLADGSTQSVSVPAPANGFDVAQSGSWYDPTTSGQGVELSVQPASGGSAGLLFGAWFTYDPNGLSNDDVHHHWFSLQGDLSQARQGKVTLPIFQTLGTQLDGAPTRNTNPVGHATLTMTACGQATLDYQFNAPLAHAFAGASGTLHLNHFGAACSP